MEKLGVPLQKRRQGQAFRYNLFVRASQKGFSLQSFTQIKRRFWKFNFLIEMYLREGCKWKAFSEQSEEKLEATARFGSRRTRPNYL